LFGTFSLTLPVGVFTVQARKDGFQPIQDAVSVPAGLTIEWSRALLADPVVVDPVVARAGPNRYQAGFGTSVQLDASGSTGPAGAPLSYQWTRVAGPVGPPGGAAARLPRCPAWPPGASAPRPPA
jgi:hypothetical protein